MDHTLHRAVLAAALLAGATLAAAQQPTGPFPSGGGGGIGQSSGPGVQIEDRREVERTTPTIGRDDALVPGASLGSLGRQQDVEAETCVIRPVMSDAQLKLCGANPPAYQPPAPKPAQK